jgi:gamma-glutamylcyclotransferase (GGCT)/AIG2-like uncharacterized protein YtfP
MQHELLFVYGSLKAGRPLHSVLAGAEFVGAYKTEPEFKLMNLGAFPALVPATDGGVMVSGEVYKIDEELLNYLDILEGVGREMYSREKITVRDALGNRIAAWTYIGRKAALFAHEEIKSGVW